MGDDAALEPDNGLVAPHCECAVTEGEFCATCALLHLTVFHLSLSSFGTLPPKPNSA